MLVLGIAGGAAQASQLMKPAPEVTVPQVLIKLYQQGQISQSEYTTDRYRWAGAIAEEKTLGGWRRQDLTDVTALLNELANTKKVTAARLPILFLTLQNNMSYWKTGKQLVYADRVSFPGSLLEWEYYPGYGLQLQVLGTFGEANGFYEAGKADYPKLAQVLDEMEQVAVPRAGGVAWEYYFNWEGGAPPWVSAMAQATGIEALANGYLATGDESYLTEAHDALPLLEQPPPTGVAVNTTLGRRYLQYSFAPHTDIINAFLQTLIGLYDYAQVSHDTQALHLFNIGNAQAESELPSFVVSGWSLYQPGELDDLNYHELVTGFAQSLCKKLAVAVYCNTANDFAFDLQTVPTLTQITRQAPPNQKFSFFFNVTKPAYVGITVSRNGKNYIYTKKEFFEGTHSFSGPKLKAGIYSVTMSVTDIAGHYKEITGQLQICSTGCPALPPIALPPVPTPTTTTSTSTSTTTTPTTTTTSTTSTTTTPTTTTTTGTGTGTTTTGGGTGGAPL